MVTLALSYTNTGFIDEQLVQLYELMQAIHNPSADDGSSGAESK